MNLQELFTLEQQPKVFFVKIQIVQNKRKLHCSRKQNIYSPNTILGPTSVLIFCFNCNFLTLFRHCFTSLCKSKYFGIHTWEPFPSKRLHLLRFKWGESANAVPNYHKLCSRVPHIRGNRRLQPSRSAMEGSRPGGTALLITVSPEPGKYVANCILQVSVDNPRQ